MVIQGTSDYGYSELDLAIGGPTLVESGAVLDMGSQQLTNANAELFVIEDGAQVKHSTSNVKATVKKHVTGYGADNANTNNGYVLLASPVSYISVPVSDDPTGLRTGTYDLYQWRGDEALEWRNYGSEHMTRYSGSGFLYANQADVELSFSGTLSSSANSQYVIVFFHDEPSGATQFSDFNLFGNPFMCDAYLVDAETDGSALAYYRMNASGNGFEAVADGSSIAPMQGIFYQDMQHQSGSRVYFSRTAPTRGQTLNINLKEASTRNNGNIDRAIVRFDGGNTLEKFCFNESGTKLYIPQGHRDFAVVRSGNEGELPLNFKAEKNGSYTLNFNAEEVEFGYLHLIDNLTGVNVDLLSEPSYTFEAKTTDYASRFKLVFATVCEDANGDNETFAFINGNGEIVLTLETCHGASLQIVDMMGRVLVSTDVARNVSTSGLTPGVYVLRLINGNDV